MIQDVHWRLREATRQDHERLEGKLSIVRQAASHAGRRELVVRYWRLHAAAEAALAPWLAEIEALDFESRRRTPILRRDLADLGLAAPATGPRPSVRGVGEALGLMYVLEGSTLGGRVIRRQIEAAGGDFQGLGFLDPYGAGTGGRWRTFLEVLARETADAAEAAGAVRGAIAGFDHAAGQLCAETVGG